MSTPINDFQDILDAMERNPALAKELRRHVLTDELLHVPAALLAFMEEQRKFNQEQRKFNEDMTYRMTNVETRLTRIEGDFGTTKGYYARNIAANDAAGMADDMGMTLVRTLSTDNLREMIQGHPMEIQTRRSFRNADLVMEAATPVGETRFIAVEVSYTADRRDSDRAIRNASILNEITGRTATPVVASVRNTREVRELVESGTLHWHPLEDRTPEAE